MALKLYEYNDNIEEWNTYAKNDRLFGQSIIIGTVGDYENMYLEEVKFKCRRQNAFAFTDVYVAVHKYEVEDYMFRSESCDVSGLNISPNPYEWLTFTFNTGILKRGIPYCILIHAETDEATNLNIETGGRNLYSGGGAVYRFQVGNWTELYIDSPFRVYGLKAPTTTPSRPPPTPPLERENPITNVGRSADNYITETLCIESDLFRFFGEHIDNINHAKDKVLKNIKRCFTYEN